MTTSPTLEIYAQPTPNPNTFKFLVNRTLLEEGTADFPNAEAAKGSPLAQGLFELPNVTGVFVGQNFITVTKTTEANWDEVGAPVVGAIRRILTSGVRLIADPQAGHTPMGMPHVAEGTTPPSPSSPADLEIEQKIRDVLDREIRPAVAMDGGDITFHSYHDGIVTLHLRGSCSACPSAVFTLRMGVENRLKTLIPEVREVVQV